MPRLPPILLLVALSAGSSVRAEFMARDIRIMVGPQVSVVREQREIACVEGEQDVLIEGLPAAADLTTLQVGGERQGVRLLGWQRVSATPSTNAKPAAVRWRPGQPLRAAPAADPAGPVRCRLQAATARTRWVELVYQVTGLTWRADYELVIRGDIANHLEPLSLDLVGHIVLSNTTGRAYPEARILLASQQAGSGEANAAPGLLMLDDWSPLADRWRSPPPAEPLPQAYSVPQAVSIPAAGRVSVRLVSTRRQAAERLYRLDAGSLAVGQGDPWRPLIRYLVLPNDEQHGLGLALPPGQALIYLGGTRGGPYQQAWLDHTDRGQAVRVRLGPSRGVTANRLTEARQPGTAGAPEQTITLQLANALPTAVKVEVWERPPVPLAWDLVRASRTVERQGQNLLFNLELAARSEAELNYTVRLTEPEP